LILLIFIYDFYSFAFPLANIKPLKATSVLLHLAVFLLPKHGFKGTLVHTACGLALIGSFFVLRLVPIPYLLYSLWANRASFDELSPSLQIASFVALPIPMLLNLYWYAHLRLSIAAPK
jgi:hypothetical protein